MQRDHKYYIWGFPGVGKSNVSFPHSVVDADCKQFQFHVPDSMKDHMHRAEGWTGIARQTSFPQNYLDYVKTVDADFVLLNCHLSLLAGFDQERMLLVYPSEDLKSEYLKRYAQRGDHISFIRHMEDSFEEMIDAVRRAPFLKYEIRDSHVFLNDLLSGGVFMSHFITKQELSTLLEEGIALGLYSPSRENVQKGPSELAQLVFDGVEELDLDKLRQSLSEKKADIEKERILQERRGGLSHEVLCDKIMQGIVNGALSIHHGEISPYSFGFEVKFPNSMGEFAKGHAPYTNRWECYCELSKVPEEICCMIENGKQDPQVFSSHSLQPLDINKMLQAIEEKEHNRLTSFVPESESGLERRHQYSGHVAQLQDVHNGVALDGIIQGHFCGNYSTITTNNENLLLRQLVALKGFCLDCVPLLGSSSQKLITDYLKAHGTDISTPEKLQAWIDANPDKCGLQANRVRKPSLDSRLMSARTQKAESAPPKSSQFVKFEREP